MSLLSDISNDVQQVAEAIRVAVGVEVEIVDETLCIIGGTGIFADMTGRREESGRVKGDGLYATVLRNGRTEFIEDAPNYTRYGSSLAANSSRGELAEICTPIELNDNVVGIIGLIALDEEQKEILIDNEHDMITYIEKMADLLAAKADLKSVLAERESQLSEMEAALESAHEGIVSIDRNGYIKHCNNHAAGLFGVPKEEITSSHISRYMKGAAALKVLKTGTGYTESEEVYKSYRGTSHFIVSATPYYTGKELDGVVISFRDIEEAQKLAYSMKTRALKYTFDDIIGGSFHIEKLKSQSATIARGSSTVLITGESGTGKEMFARAIHYSGPRSSSPFITVNCGAIPESLIESELFGYEKGAFTGADKKGKQGKFELADGGTIFLDEIGDMPLLLQVKLLHVIQNMRFERVGGNRTIIVDVRVIAATNRNLEELIEQGLFRSDLYYRLSVIPLFVPPLREHPEDIEQLLIHFLRKYNRFMNRNISGFSDAAAKALLKYAWPGNVRELENAVEYGVNMAQSDIIDMDAVPSRIKAESPVSNEDMPAFDGEPGYAGAAKSVGAAKSAGAAGLDGASNSAATAAAPMKNQVRMFEAELIRSKLLEYGDSSAIREELAKELGISRATLYRRLAQPAVNKAPSKENKEV
jgi:PAS domain S-box-containing protein